MHSAFYFFSAFAVSLLSLLPPVYGFAFYVKSVPFLCKSFYHLCFLIFYFNYFCFLCFSISCLSYFCHFILFIAFEALRSLLFLRFFSIAQVLNKSSTQVFNSSRALGIPDTCPCDCRIFWGPFIHYAMHFGGRGQVGRKPFIILLPQGGGRVCHII